MKREIKVAFKLQAYLSEMLAQPRGVFSAYYAPLLRKKISKHKKVLRDGLAVKCLPECVELVSQYEALLPHNEGMSAYLDCVYQSIGRSVRRLKTRVRHKLQSIFTEKEQFGKALDISSVQSAARGPFRRYFLTKELVAYLRGFLARTKRPSTCPTEIGDVCILDTEHILQCAYCLLCNRAISRKMLGYHEKSKQHTSRKASEVGKSTALDGLDTSIVLLSAEELKALVYELVVLVGALDGIDMNGLAKIDKELLINIGETVDWSKSKDANQPSQKTQKPRPGRLRKDVVLSCEVCNSKFAGVEPLRSHFSAPRHQDALTELGADGSKRYFGVTRKIVVSKLVECVEEEEDADGNVYDRRTYEDLVKHGLM